MSHSYDWDSDDAEESCEEKIELRANGLQTFDTAILKFCIGKDIENEAVHNVTLTCVHQNLDLGSVFARLINAEELDSFQMDMDDISHDCMDLASLVFDGAGMLQRKWLRDSVSKGSGVWTASLGQNGFLVVETIQVGMAYRRKGVGKVMLEALIKLAKNRNASYAFLWATQLNTAPDVSFNQPDSEALFSANKARATAFCRAIGFRRIGTTSCE